MSGLGMLSFARRAARKLPPGLKQRLRRTTTRSEFLRNTAGLGVNAPMAAWARSASIPISIVIPSYNDLPYLTECLASVEATLAGFEYEVIVVDDYCQPENSARLKLLENDHVRVILKANRLGFAGTVNAGMAEARHDIVLLNSDIVAQPGWLTALQYSAYEIDPKIGLVSPKLVYPNGTIQYGGTYYARLLAPQWFGHLHVGSAATRPVSTVPAYNRSVSGACVYITKAAYGQLGPLDDSYWLGFEDVDYGLRAWELGIRCYYQPAALLVHHESASRGYSQGKRELASMRYFWRRWDWLFLTRTLVGKPKLDFLISEKSSSLWREYVGDLASRLAALGHEVAIHPVVFGAPDEDVISVLAGRDSLKICCDWGANETTWLAALDHGKPVHLLPSVESVEFPDDLDLQKSIVAHYKPEFDYVAPNRHVADQLRAETAWESRARVVPVISFGPAETDDSTGAIVSVGCSDLERSAIDDFATKHEVAVHHIDTASPTKDVLQRILSLKPRCIVATGKYENSLAPLRLMSTGAAVIARRNEQLRYEILDGYNTLVVTEDSASDIHRALTDIMTDDDVWRELGANGLSTARRLLELNTAEASRAFNEIATNAV